MRLGLLVILTGFAAAACNAPNAPPRPPAAVTVAANLKSENEAPGAAASAWTPLGLQVREVSQAALKALGVANGVMVTRVRSPADRSRILPGDVIVGVNQTRISSVEEFNKLIAGQSRGTFGLLVRRADSDLYIALEVGNVSAERNPGTDLEDASRGSAAPPPAERFKTRRPATNKPLRT